MYYKGANMLHTLRQLIEDDEKWRQILRGLNKNFYHQTVTTQQIENYLSEHTGIDLTEFFNQYLRDLRIPIVEYKLKGNNFEFRYTDIVKGFDMPIQIVVDGKTQWIYPTANWKTIELPSIQAKVSFIPDFYIETKALK